MANKVDRQAVLPRGEEHWPRSSIPIVNWAILLALIHALAVTLPGKSDRLRYGQCFCAASATETASTL